MTSDIPKNPTNTFFYPFFFHPLMDELISYAEDAISRYDARWREYREQREKFLRGLLGEESGKKEKKTPHPPNG